MIRYVTVVDHEAACQVDLFQHDVRSGSRCEVARTDSGVDALARFAMRDSSQSVVRNITA